jgi:acyl-CoA synthetase (AMP-forming)/AMP-acid ligase II
MIDRLPDLLSQTAASRPDQTAVVWKNEQIPYLEVDRLTNQIADLLRNVGCLRGDRVVLLIPNSPNALFAFVGVLKSGCVAVPLDPTMSAGRLRSIVNRCQPTWILAARTARELLDELLADDQLNWPVGTLEAMPIQGDHFVSQFTGLHVLLSSPKPFDCDATGPAPAIQFFPPPAGCDPNNTALAERANSPDAATTATEDFVISHAAAIELVESFRKQYPLRESDRVGALPLQTPWAVASTFAALAAGAELHCVPDEITQEPRHELAFVLNHQLTDWFTQLATLEQLVEQGAIRHGDLPSVKRLICTDATLPNTIVQELAQRMPLTQIERVDDSRPVDLEARLEIDANAVLSESLSGSLLESQKKPKQTKTTPERVLSIPRG